MGRRERPSVREVRQGGGRRHNNSLGEGAASATRGERGKDTGAVARGGEGGATRWGWAPPPPSLFDRERKGDWGRLEVADDRLWESMTGGAVKLVGIDGVGDDIAEEECQEKEREKPPSPPAAQPCAASQPPLSPDLAKGRPPPAAARRFRRAVARPPLPQDLAEGRPPPGVAVVGGGGRGRGRRGEGEGEKMRGEEEIRTRRTTGGVGVSQKAEWKEIAFIHLGPN
uniref:Uncharacterized protein n=1 Tax=Oryza glumipatula TaxID=40148 RepID=A0A0E0BCG5_9ORYZ